MPRTKHTAKKATGASASVSHVLARNNPTHSRFPRMVASAHQPKQAFSPANATEDLSMARNQDAAGKGGDQVSH